MTHQITQIVGPMLDAAIEQHRAGDEVVWDSALMPDPENQGGAVYVVFVWIKGYAMDSVLQGSFMIRNPLAIETDGVDEIVSRFLMELRQARSASLSKQPPAEEPLTRGQQRSSGLLIP